MSKESGALISLRSIRAFWRAWHTGYAIVLAWRDGPHTLRNRWRITLSQWRANR